MQGASAEEPVALDESSAIMMDYSLLTVTMLATTGMGVHYPQKSEAGSPAGRDQWTSSSFSNGGAFTDGVD